MYALCETDPTRVDRKRAEHLVHGAIEAIGSGKVDSKGGLAGLVALLSIQGNPYDSIVLDFVWEQIEKGGPATVGTVVESISRSATPEAARTLFSLLRRDRGGQNRHAYVAALGQVGDPAVFEAIESANRGETDEETVFDVLALVQSVPSTRALWNRYQLEPPSALAVRWAEVWASRLGHRSHDEVLSTVPVPAVNEQPDPLSWPYSKSVPAANAAVLCRAIEVLSSTFEDIWSIFARVTEVSRWSLRVQIPLLLKAFSNTKWSWDTLRAREKEILNHNESDGPLDPLQTHKSLSRVAAEALQVGGAAFRESYFADPLGAVQELKGPKKRVVDKQGAQLNRAPRDQSPWRAGGLFGIFTEHAWQVAGGYVTRTRISSRARAKRAGSVATGITEGLAIVGSTYALGQALPTGSAFGALGYLLHITPYWSIYFTGFLALASVFMAVAFPMYRNRPPSGLVDKGLLAVIYFFTMFSGGIVFSGVLVLLSPVLLFFFPIWTEGTETMERWVTSGNTPWRQLCYLGAVSTATALPFGVAGISIFFVQPWGVALFVGLALFTTVMLQFWCTAFRVNRIAEWLQQHSRGDEVLGEFRRWGGIATPIPATEVRARAAEQHD